MRNTPFWSMFLLSVSLTAGMAQAAESGKDAYHLFNPTPVAQMRDMSTDRPDQTESPYTVDAGHFQIEADLIKYTWDSYEKDGTDTRTRSLNVLPVNLKAGLTDSTDLQIVLDNYLMVKDSDKAAGTSERTDGMGDVTVRLKHNLWGNEGGTTAFAVMPYLKMPTNQNDLGNDAVEGGLILPLAIDLGGGYGLGMMTKVDWLKDADNKGYHASFTNSASFAVEWNDRIGTYYELFTEKGTDSGNTWVVTADTGITYALSANVQLDAGINIGLTEAADDYQPFIGMTVRF